MVPYATLRLRLFPHLRWGFANYSITGAQQLPFINAGSTAKQEYLTEWITSTQLPKWKKSTPQPVPYGTDAVTSKTAGNTGSPTGSAKG